MPFVGHNEKWTPPDITTPEGRAKIAKRLITWTPESTPIGFKRRPGYAKGDEDTPFFSEAYLYTLLGKEDARTLLALMRPVWEMLGIPRMDQP